MSEHALGFDVGLSGVRATVVRDDGVLVAGARRPHERVRMGDGIAEHDPGAWLHYALPGFRPPVPLPVRVDPVGIAGELGSDWAARLGLRPGLPVAVGTYDSFVDIAAAGVRRPGDSGLLLGSTMIICRATEDGVNPPARIGVSAYPGQGLLVGGWTLSGGLVLDWFSSRFGAGEDLASAAATTVHPSEVLADKPELDVHLIDVIAACGVSAAEARTVSVSSRFEPWTELRLEREPAGHHVHDRTRPADEQ
jgi:sugar (pentulose or hexulose) kinase